MRILRVLAFGALPVTALLAACGSVTETPATTSGTSGTTGAGGSGGASVAASSAASTGGAGGATGAGGASGTGGAKGDGGMLDIGDPSTNYPAKHGPPPQVVTFGGSVLNAPKIYPVFFANDDAKIKASLTDFDTKVGATEYWKAIGKEYGVGIATATSAIELAEDAPKLIDDSEIQTWLADKLNADDPAFGVVDDDAIITLHYPATTTITEGGQGSESCKSFGGYHNSITLDAAHGEKPVAYAVVPRCSNFGGLTGIDAVTGAESHELIEAATDPYPMQDPAFAQIDNGHIYWMRLLGGGEVGDMCAQFEGSFTKFDELPDYVVQRSWSNKAAKAGHDPCVPVKPGSIYFNAAPVLPDTVTASVFGQKVNVKGLKIPLGETRVVDLQLFSDGDTGGPWKVDVKDLSELFGGNKHLDISLDAAQGQNGQTLHATITVTSTGKNNTESFVVMSSLGGRTNLWAGIIAN